MAEDREPYVYLSEDLEYAIQEIERALESATTHLKEALRLLSKIEQHYKV